jgi:hypothetical protein
VFSDLRPSVPSVAVSRLDLGSRSLPAVRAQGLAHVIALLELPAAGPANKSFVAFGFNQFPLPSATFSFHELKMAHHAG